MTLEEIKNKYPDMEKSISNLEVHDVVEKRLYSLKKNKVGSFLIPIDIDKTARIIKIEPNMGDFSVLFDIGKTVIEPKNIYYPINKRDYFTIGNDNSKYECLKIKVIRVEDLEEDEIIKVTDDILYADIVEDLEDKIMIYTNVIFKGQKIYRDNPYVFYVETKQVENKSQQNMQ